MKENINMLGRKQKHQDIKAIALKRAAIKRAKTSRRTLKEHMVLRIQ
jgi:hypothetical protein